MKKSLAIAIALALPLAACGKGSDKAPQGQVVATVDGEEITLTELMAEAGPGVTDPQQQSAALQRIVARRLLAAEAKKRGLDSTPLAAVFKRAGEDEALSKTLARDIADRVPAVSQSEVDEFIRTYPATVSQRRILNVDQIAVPELSAPLVEQIKGLHTMADAERVLMGANVQYKKATGTIDGLTLEPNFLAGIVDTEGRDIFMYPQNGGYVIGSVLSSRVQPLTGKAAQDTTRALLTQRRKDEQTTSAVSKILSEGKAKVKVNPAFEKAPAAPASTAPKGP